MLNFKYLENIDKCKEKSITYNPITEGKLLLLNRPFSFMCIHT